MKNFMDDDEEFKQYLDANKWDCIPDEFVVFDLETTGLTPQTDRIVEIGAILFRKDLYLKSGEVNQFQCFVKQEKPIPKEAIAIHGITDDMVVDGDSEYAALTEFFMFIGNLPLYAYNAKFDNQRFESEHFGVLPSEVCDWYKLKLRITDTKECKNSCSQCPFHKYLCSSSRSSYG